MCNVCMYTTTLLIQLTLYDNYKKWAGTVRSKVSILLVYRQRINNATVCTVCVLTDVPRSNSVF